MDRLRQPIKLIALDVDGTLLDPAEEIRPRVRRAIHLARESGILVTLATGRRLAGAQAIAADLDLRLPLILHGGAVIQDSATGAVIYQDPHEPEVIAAIVAVTRRHGFEPVVYESPALGGRLYVGPGARQHAPTLAYERLRGPFHQIDYDRMDSVRQPLAVSILGEVGSLRPLADELSRVEGAAPLLSDWALFQCEAIEVFRTGCSKASAVRHLAEAHHVRMDEVMAIGDGLNDCEILAAVGLGVAMGNACPEARAVARVQVGSNEQDGVAEAIERFVLETLPD